MRRVTHPRRTPPSPIGESVPRRDGIAKVTGRGALHGRHRVCPVLPTPRSCAARTRTRASASIDTAAARRHPGVIAVVTADDLPDVHLVYGHAVADHPLIATGKVRFAGEPVVGVVAEDPVTAEEALRLIEVDYEPLPFSTSAADSLAADAPIIHEKPGEQRAHRGFEEDIERTHANVCSHSRQAWGDIDDAFARRRPGRRGRVPLPALVRLRDGAVQGGRPVGRGRADRLDVRPASVHGPRGPGALLRPAAVRRARHRPVRRRRLRQQVVHQDRAADRGARAACRSPGPARPDHRGKHPDHARRRGDGPPAQRLRS